MGSLMFVCRSRYCFNYWTACDYVGICPHSSMEDHKFSCNCLQSYLDIKSGVNIECATKKHHVSVIQFLCYCFARRNQSAEKPINNNREVKYDDD